MRVQLLSMHTVAAAAAAGTTYNPDQGEVLGLPGGLDTCMSYIAEVCAVCNESKLDCSEGTFKGVGAPTEASLKVRAVDVYISLLMDACFDNFKHCVRRQMLHQVQSL